MVKAIAILLVSTSWAGEPGTVPAGIKKDFAQCVTIDGELARLDCFDQTAKKHGLKQKVITKAPAAGMGNWKVAVVTNPLDDTQTATASLEAESGRSRWGKPVTLNVRCKSLLIELWINWGEYLGLEKTSVLSRIGGAPASESTWPLSTDNQATFYPDGGDFPFLESLLPERRLVAQTVPHGENPTTAIFKLDGLEKALGPLKKACPDSFFDLGHDTATVSENSLTTMRDDMMELLSPEDHSTWESGWNSPNLISAGCVGPRMEEHLRAIAKSPTGAQGRLLNEFSQRCSKLLAFSGHGQTALQGYYSRKLQSTSDGAELRKLLSPEDRLAWDAQFVHPEAFETKCIGERLSDAVNDIARSPKESRESMITAHANVCASLLLLSKDGESKLREYLEAKVMAIPSAKGND